MSRVVFQPDAREAYLALRKDPTRESLLEAVRHTIDLLGSDPGERRFTTGLWGVRIRDRTEDWIVLWEEHTDDKELVVVRYLGPDSFT